MRQFRIGTFAGEGGTKIARQRHL